MSEVRLIDANALKEDFDCVGFNDYDDYNRALRIIDNAPTVEPESLIKPIAEIKCELTEEEKQRLIELLRKERPQLVRLEPERPQGEWINHRNDYGHNIADCSLCGKATQWHDEDEDGVPRYCWYCGASMKGGAE